MSIFQYRHRLDDPLWSFGMAGARIFDAIRIVKNDHRKNWEFSNIESTGD